MCLSSPLIIRLFIELGKKGMRGLIFKMLIQTIAMHHFQVPFKLETGRMLLFLLHVHPDTSFLVQLRGTCCTCY